DEATQRVTFAKAQNDADVARLQQEVRNLANERDIAARLIAQLPELAAQMPEIHELKVLQSGNGDGAFDALPAFLARVLAVAESMGVRLLPERAENGQG
ncbi:hypothetical protein HC891_28425, partial [Candidatus Gracilibacteria bacterium]|nr:hypothetical protein [Candidatus Gracilibacteria bacterium]